MAKAKSPSPSSHSVKLETPKDARAYFAVILSGHVTAANAKALAEEARAQVDKMQGRSFALLFDLRAVTKFDDDATAAMQGIEMYAADKGLEVVAHLVKQAEVVKKLESEMKAAGAANLIRNYTDEKQARAFVSGF